METRNIILFDGDCALCNNFVKFVIARDKRAIIFFAPLQSDLGKQLLDDHGLQSEKIDTVVLIKGNRAYTKSDAALRTLSLLGLPYNLTTVFLVLPRIIRNSVYDFVAKNRFKWFGKTDSCSLMQREWKDRFL